MLEDACHKLDNDIACSSSKEQSNLNNEYIKMRKHLMELEDSAAKMKDTIELINNAIVAAVLKNPEDEEGIRQIYEPRLNHFSNKLDEKVCLL